MQSALPRSRIFRVLPVAVAITALLSSLAFLFSRCRHKTLGHFVYILDDSYIHMAIAKNLVLHGVWGVTRHEFSSASSSPLWTSLIALGFKMGGIQEMLPLLLCTVLSVLVLLTVDWIARREGVPAWLDMGLLLAVVFAAPLLLLSLSGMEHVLQILLDLVFLYLAAGCTCEPGRISPRQLGVLFFAAAGVCAVRYEGLFLVAAAALFLAWHRKWIASVAVMAGGVAPVAVFAVYSVRNGGLWLPNSVLLKGGHPNFHTLHGIVNSLGGLALHNLTLVSVLFALAFVALAVLAFPHNDDDAAGTPDIGWSMLAMTVMTLLCHLQFARVGDFFRYESYLIVMLLASLTVTVAGRASDFSPDRGPKGRRKIFAAIVGMLLLCGLLVDRAVETITVVPTASGNIFQQQMQASHFVHRYYDGGSAALNDIGAVDFYNDIHLLDVVGLGANDVARRCLAGTWNTESINALSRQKNVSIALVYDSYLARRGGVPSSWVKVATWQISSNRVCAHDTVSVYATEPAEADAATAHFKEFRSRLPPGVAVWVR